MSKPTPMYDGKHTGHELPAICSRGLRLKTELAAGTCKVEVQWGGQSNHRGSFRAYGSVADMSRLRPGLRYLVRHGTVKSIRDYFRSFAQWSTGRTYVVAY